MCLHNHPQWRNYSGIAQGQAYIYGTEYENMDRHNLFKKTYTENLNNNDPPCAVCYCETRAAKLMIPGRKECNDGWTKEYEGYLVTGPYGTKKSSHVYECLDVDPESIAGGHRSNDGASMYVVQMNCGSGSLCPNYIAWREITCVVCTK